MLTLAEIAFAKSYGPDLVNTSVGIVIRFMDELNEHTWTPWIVQGGLFYV